MRIKIEAGLFDAGGVLHSEDMEYVHKDIIQALGLQEEIYRKAWNEIHPTHGRGELTDREFWEQLRAKAGPFLQEPTDELLIREYTKRFTPNREVLEMVRTLKQQGIKVAIVSNTIHPHIDFNIWVGLYNEFPVRVLSSEVGVRKPDSRIFGIALERLQVTPVNAFFVDDREDNVITARNLGLHGILFKTADQLRSDLRNLGVKLSVTRRR